MSNLIIPYRLNQQFRNLFLICAFALPVVTQAQKWQLPEESAGIDSITQTLISVFDQADIIALGETHKWKLDNDLRIAVVRHPALRKKKWNCRERNRTLDTFTYIYKKSKDLKKTADSNR